MDSLAIKPLPISFFQYRYDGELMIKDIRRAEPSEVIRLLFEPKNATPSDLQKWRIDHANIVKLPWLRAQVDLYGGYAPAGIPKEECLKWLQNQALKPNFATLYSTAFRMRDFDQDIKAKWEKQCLDYEESLRTGRHEQEFRDLATLEEKLCYDADMFMEVYFGDRNTLRRPVAFRGVNFDVVLKVASRVPGLVAQTVGRDYHKMLWIGWDKRRVEDACNDYKFGAAKINVEARRKIQRKHDDVVAKRCEEKRQEKREEHEKRRHNILRDRLKQHHVYMLKPGRRVGIEGSYIVDVTDHEFQLQYYSQSRKWIDIRSTSTPGVYEATFDIRPMGQGVMLLSKSMESLSDHADGCDAFRAAGVGDDTGTFRAFQIGFRLGMKRKRQEAEDYEASQWSRKSNRRKIPTGFSRYYMRWRGIEMKLKDYWRREKGRNEERHGWVEFKEDTLGHFIVDFGVETINGEVHGYKVDDQPLSPGGDWASLQEVVPLPPELLWRP